MCTDIRKVLTFIHPSVRDRHYIIVNPLTCGSSGCPWALHGLRPTTTSRRSAPYQERKGTGATTKVAFYWVGFGHSPDLSHLGMGASWRMCWGASPGKMGGKGKGKRRGNFEQTCFEGDLGSVETEDPFVGSSNEWKDEGEELWR